MGNSLIGFRKEEDMQDINLTDREKDVLVGLVKGWTNKEIATTLNVTHHTIKAHISAILHKFGTKNRTEAALFAMNNNP